MKPLAPLASLVFALALSSHAWADEAAKSGPPSVIGGVGVGVAHPVCGGCDLPLGAGVRSFVLFPVLPVLGLGTTFDYSSFSPWHSPAGQYTFIGPLSVVLSNGFGAEWQIELWGTFFGGANPVQPHVDARGGLAVEGTIRVGRRLSSRTRLSLALSTASLIAQEKRADNAAASGASSYSPLSGVTLLTLDFSYDLVLRRD